MFDIIKEKEHGDLWTFKTWISNFKDVNLPIGDLAEDIINDPDFPNSDYFAEIYEHLHSKGTKEIVIETFVSAWNYYLASNAIPEGQQYSYNEIFSHKDI